MELIDYTPKISVQMIMGLHTPTFRIGVQTFHLQGREEKEDAEWFCERLKTAFDNLTSIKNESER